MNDGDSLVSCPAVTEECFEQWKQTFAKLYGDPFLGPGVEETEVLRKFYRTPSESSFHELLFHAHARFASTVLAEAERRSFPLSVPVTFVYCRRNDEDQRARMEPCDSPDAFKSLYQSLVPRKIRHALGEYFTPDWLAELILDEAGYDGAPGKRLLDPCCGTGTFLVLAIQRAKRYGRTHGEAIEDTIRRVRAEIRGIEVNPLSALAAQVNYLMALAEPGYCIEEPAPVFYQDAILDPLLEESFDYVVGNPPWLRWDYLSPEFRQATAHLWEAYGLFSLHGFQAWLGAGKKDLSMLFTYFAADRYLKPGGTLGFLITQEVFKSKGAGEGFRRFRLGESGEFLQVIKAHDFTNLRPFEGVRNKPAAIFLSKGRETDYPLPYSLWERNGEGLVRRPALARPMGSPTGPWQTVAVGQRAELFDRLDGNNPYQAVLGANANPYGVFWLKLERVLADGKICVRNLPEMGKKAIPAVTASMEGELVFPAVRGRDISRWRARSYVYVLLVQDPQTRAGFAESTVKRLWPGVYQYLVQFRDELLNRALYKKYHARSSKPFYSQFNVSPATFSPYKVVWQRMSSDLRAAVIARQHGVLGSKIVVPLETTAFIAAASAGEAHYLCAVLNSAPVREFVKTFSANGRGFGTPWVVNRIKIPPFDHSNPTHLELAAISNRLHRQAGKACGDLQRMEAMLGSLVKRCL